MSPPRRGRRNLPLALVLGSLVLVWGCSFIDRSSRPDPAAEDHVRCGLDYRPEHRIGGGSDLVFRAWSSPYREEEFYMSLPDVTAHLLFAPGRHLSTDLHLEGADCPGAAWKKGFRLPLQPKLEKILVCRRRGTEAVSFRVETRWGSCTQEIPAGDLTPRPDRWIAWKLEHEGIDHPGLPRREGRLR